MSVISIPFTFSAGAVIVASQHNSNFSTIYSDYNGNIDNTNIAPNAGIIGSKLDLSSPGNIGATSPATGAFTVLKVGTTNQGDILYDNGISFVRLTSGTSGTFLTSNGTNSNPSWSGSAHGVQVFTSGTNTFTAPSGITKVYVTMVGGGGGGGGSDSNNGAGGGGGAANVLNLAHTVVPGNGYTAIVGTGGATGAAGGGNGGVGGTSSFDSTISAAGGLGGIGTTAGRNGGFGGGPATLLFDATATTAATGQTGGGYVIRGGNGAAGTSGGGGVGGAGGGTIMGPGAAGPANANAGIAGAVNTGVGGSGCSGSINSTGGAGGSGIVILIY